MRTLRSTALAAAPAWLAVALSLAVGACGARAATAPRAPARLVTAAVSPADVAPPTVRSHACPLAVPGSSVVAAEVASGLALTFTTSGDVEALRVQVREMALWLVALFAAPEEEIAWNGPGGLVAARDEELVRLEASVEDVTRGARLTVSIDSPDLIDELRSGVRALVDDMRRGACPWFEDSERPTGADTAPRSR